MVVRKKLDNLSLKGIFHVKKDELNSLKIRFFKMNFEFKQFYFYYFLCVRFWAVTGRPPPPDSPPSPDCTRPGENEGRG